MHTKTYLKAASHQLGLAKSETQEFGHAELAKRIEAAERLVASLIRESYDLAAPGVTSRLAVS